MDNHLTPELVLRAYSHGIFPMHDDRTGEVSWYRPDPRAILPLEGLHVSRSLASTVRRGRFEVRFDTQFEQVMRLCAQRPEGTWISEEFVQVYGQLQRLGCAHSVEAWSERGLAGGLYGVAIGGAFMGESMFHRETDASKVALAALVERLRSGGFTLLDVQFQTRHLASLGAVQIPASRYARLLDRAMRVAARWG